MNELTSWRREVGFTQFLPRPADDSTYAKRFMITANRQMRCHPLALVLGLALVAISYIVAKPVKFEPFTEALQKLGMYWLPLNHQPRWER